MKPQDYEIDVQPLSEEDGGGFVAIVPALPGCMSDGDTPEQALTNAYDAVASWIEAAEKAGRTIPAAKVYA